ncbi:MAG: hypothetical protein ACXADX_20065 [Candidatus Hodarchaeales archaeon]|jgi:hypothetical protein
MKKVMARILRDLSKLINQAHDKAKWELNHAVSGNAEDIARAGEWSEMANILSSAQFILGLAMEKFNITPDDCSLPDAREENKNILAPKGGLDIKIFDRVLTEDDINRLARGEEVEGEILSGPLQKKPTDDRPDKS